MQENEFSPNVENAAPKRYRSFRCPICRTDLSVTKDQVGTTIECPDCDSEVVVPDYLDFETETDYERQFSNANKEQRDLLYSPMRNPNRDGVSVDEANVYDAVSREKATAAQKGEVSWSQQGAGEYIPIRCRVCDTFMQVPRELLGREVECPDCGTKTVVTESLLNQQRSIEVKFQPQVQEAYQVGAVPDAPAEWFQLNDGRMVKVNRENKEVAPEFKSTDRHFDPSAKRKKRAGRLVAPEAATSLERAFQMAPRSKMAEDYERKMKEKIHREDEARGLAAVFVALKRLLRLRKSRLSSNAEETLPPLVLRMKNGEYVWTKASPPRRRPLFNGTFRPLICEEMIAHIAATVVVLGLIAVFLVNVMFPAFEAARNPHDAISRLEILVCWLLAVPGFCFTTGFLGLTFWSIFHAGYEGSSIVPYWRSEGAMFYAGYGLYFSMLLATTAATGAILGGVVLRLSGDSGAFVSTLLAAGITTGMFWILFPIFWLSTMQSGLFFAPITSGIARSFASQKSRWTELFVFATIFLAAPTFAWTLTVGKPLFWYLSALVVPYLISVSGLLFGRMAWIIDDASANAEFDD